MQKYHQGSKEVLEAMPVGLREMAEKLEDVHAQFACAYASGKSAVVAYQSIKPDATERSARLQAGKLLKRPEIVEFIRAFRAASLGKDLLNFVERRAILAKIARDEGVDANKRIQAVLADAKLTGEIDGKAQPEGSELERLAERIRPTLGLPMRQEG